MPELPIPPTLRTELLSCVPAREFQVRARVLPLMRDVIYVLLGYWPIYALFIPPLPFLPPSLPQDLRRLFPDERDMVQITLVEAKDILSSFDHRLRAYTERLIRRRKSMQILKASVTGTSPFLICSFNFPFHSPS